MGWASEVDLCRGWGPGSCPSPASHWEQVWCAQWQPDWGVGWSSNLVETEALAAVLGAGPCMWGGVAPEPQSCPGVPRL